jgi:hypothetical protein
MPHPYSEETREILEDFIQALGKDARVDADFLAELRRMVDSGTLDSSASIQRAVANLKAKADKLYDQRHTSSEL